MHIGIYIGGTPSRVFDCTQVLTAGNPGIGGTEYEFIMLATWLRRYAESHPGWKLTVFQGGRYDMGDGFDMVVGASMAEMPEQCRLRGIDVLVLDSRWPLGHIRAFDGTSTGVVAWCHCVGSMYRHLLYARYPGVRKVVFVSRGHMLGFIDNPVAAKSTYAFNAVSHDKAVDRLREANPFVKRPHDVVFMGALDESKGFHVLAKAWPEVLKAVPDARLHVIGSANLYGADAHMGPLGIAAEDYEATFADCIKGPDGGLHPSIILHGQLAGEKYDVMARCRVGVPNPDGATETFCICAVEMELCGCRVVTSWSSGYIDTVPAPNVLVRKRSELAQRIADALLDDTFDGSPVIDHIERNFSMDSVGSKWIDIFESVRAGTAMEEHIDIPREFRRRQINARLRRYLPFVPPVGLLGDTLARFKAVMKRKFKR